jgi:hypothetical protein
MAMEGGAFSGAPPDTVLPGISAHAPLPLVLDLRAPREERLVEDARRLYRRR